VPSPLQQSGGKEAFGDTRDYASMSDEEIRKFVPPLATNPGVPAPPISQEQIDDFRLDKESPGLLFKMIQDKNLSPDNYDSPLAKRIAGREQRLRLKQEQSVRDNPFVPPTPKPAPDGTPENPFPMQPMPTPLQQPQGPEVGIAGLGGPRPEYGRGPQPGSYGSPGKGMRPQPYGGGFGGGFGGYQAQQQPAPAHVYRPDGIMNGYRGSPGKANGGIVSAYRQR
jgi:hypothetical protein